MSLANAIRARLAHPVARRWLIAGGLVGIGHVWLLSVLPPNVRLDRYVSQAESPVGPIYLDITPRARPARPAREIVEVGATDRATRHSPMGVRRAPIEAAPSLIAPLVVDTPPATSRPTVSGRVVPQSWRERCGLGDGEVSDAAWSRCRDSLLSAVQPTSPPVRRRGDAAQDFAAEGAARIAAYDARRALAPTGSGNLRPSSTPGSNFGMGEIDASIGYGVGQRPVVNGGID